MELIRIRFYNATTRDVYIKDFAKVLVTVDIDYICIEQLSIGELVDMLTGVLEKFDIDYCVKRNDFGFGYDVSMYRENKIDIIER